MLLRMGTTVRNVILKSFFFFFLNFFKTHSGSLLQILYLTLWSGKMTAIMPRRHLALWHEAWIFGKKNPPRDLPTTTTTTTRWKRWETFSSRGDTRRRICKCSSLALQTTFSFLILLFTPDVRITCCKQLFGSNNNTKKRRRRTFLPPCRDVTTVVGCLPRPFQCHIL